MHTGAGGSSGRWHVSLLSFLPVCNTCRQVIKNSPACFTVISSLLHQKLIATYFEMRANFPSKRKSADASLF